MPNKIYIISKNKQRVSLLMHQFRISFPRVDIMCASCIQNLQKDTNQLNDIIIYDTHANGLISKNEIMRLGGSWLSIHEECSEAVQTQCLMDGFSGVISLSDPIDLYPKVIRCIAQRDIWYPRSVISLAIRQYQSKAITSQEMIEFAISNLDLTLREKELLNLIVKGHSNQAIADYLCISINTVKTHVSRILSKLNVQSRSELQCVLNDYLARPELYSVAPIH